MTRILKNAEVVRFEGWPATMEALKDGKVDVVAGNRVTTPANAMQLLGSRLLDDRFGKQVLALFVPKGKMAARAYAQEFVTQAIVSGLAKNHRPLWKAGTQSGIGALSTLKLYALSCNDRGHGRPMIAIRDADDCGSPQLWVERTGRIEVAPGLRRTARCRRCAPLADMRCGSCARLRRHAPPQARKLSPPWHINTPDPAHPCELSAQS